MRVLRLAMRLKRHGLLLGVRRAALFLLVEDRIESSWRSFGLYQTLLGFSFVFLEFQRGYLLRTFIFFMNPPLVVPWKLDHVCLCVLVGRAQKGSLLLAQFLELLRRSFARSVRLIRRIVRILY